VEIGLKALADVDTAALRHVYVDFNGSGLKVLGLVLAQGPVSQLTVNNPSHDVCK